MLLFAEPSWQFAPFAATFLSRYEFCKRGIQTQKEPISPAGEDLQEEDSISVRPTSDSFKVSTLRNKALRASSLAKTLSDLGIHLKTILEGSMIAAIV